jgi:hypothetical protein
MRDPSPVETSPSHSLTVNKYHRPVYNSDEPSKEDAMVKAVVKPNFFV